MEVSWSDLRTSATALEREVDELLAKVNGFLPAGGLNNMNSAQITAQRHAELLAGGAPQETSALSNRAKSSDYLLKENDRINSCDRLLDEQISIAIGVKESLHGQRMGMTDINKKLHQLSKNLMQKIRAKKRKDTIILAAVIVGCMIFMFFFLMH
ncbi:Golgi SNAP receptor complex member 1 [Aphelenchoides fujianensis]|nr:Golgi SNAP receptor complex member 1 [Aphelenchoides fujianensis]